ncbi:MAG: hypothetical protein GX896_04400, partial [Clostridiales bacterium]|nr:hypothetical protein [Clostridiales bacterium]
KAYTTEMLNSNLIFNIPVYNNMPASACTLPNTTASTNDLLDSITIDNYSLSPSFNKYTNEYTLKVTPDVKTVTINAKANDSSATISGTGTKNIAVGNNKFTITCKSAGGTTRNYVITISKDPASYSLGDPSGDTKVNIYDAILVTRSINGNYTFNAEQQIAADANKDGKVNIFDAIYITRFVNGYFDEL